MEAFVTTFETSKRLKAAGFPQDSQHEWRSPFRSPSQADIVHFRANLPVREKCELIAAPTPQELADQLPGNIKLYRSKRWFAVDAALKSEIAQNVGEADTMVEALAAMWLAIREGQR
jgi:hypothetical protein